MVCVVLVFVGLLLADSLVRFVIWLVADGALLFFRLCVC